MAWQSMTGMGGGGNGSGNGVAGQDGGQQNAQPQGTDYTLQGTISHQSKTSRIEEMLMGVA
jgi:striatin 1/3/4